LPVLSDQEAQVLWKVQRQAIAWGIGTAIGELPPYFVARAGTCSVCVCAGV
jgi:hypothetical protein